MKEPVLVLHGELVPEEDVRIVFLEKLRQRLDRGGLIRIRLPLNLRLVPEVVPLDHNSITSLAPTLPHRSM